MPDMSALFKIGYGLYVVTSNNGKKDNGFICNTVMQLTNSPARIGVAINKANYSHEIIKESGIMNVNCLTEGTPFAVFQNYGFRSGRDTDKFDGCAFLRSENELAVPTENVNSYMSLWVESYQEVGTHGIFICLLTESVKSSEISENSSPKRIITTSPSFNAPAGMVTEGTPTIATPIS